MINNLKKTGTLAIVCTMCISMILLLGSCSNSNNSKPEEKKEESKTEQKINLFVAASLTAPINEIVKNFEKENPNVKVLVNADSSGKLQTQIQEGFDCDIFFSASTREITELQEKKIIEKNAYTNLLENQLAIIAYKDYEGKVKNLKDLKYAKSIALPYGSVPVGYYARKAMITDGILEGNAEDKKSVKEIPGGDISKALGGVTVSEQSNVSTAVNAVAEKSTEVGFAYTSDLKRNKHIKIISKVNKKLTGEIIYPIAKIKSKGKTTTEHKDVVDKLYKYLQTNESKKVYEKYGFTAK